MKTLDACLACGLDATRAPVRHIRKYDRLVACPRCGLLYANPQQEPDELSELYSKLYYDETTAATGRSKWGADPERKIFETLWTVLSDRFGSLCSDGARVLDYGCGVGQFLAVARSMGAECKGIEFSGEAAAYVRDHVGVDVTEGAEDDLAAEPDDSYDLIVMHSVLEHLRDPLHAARVARQKLARGGALVVFVPNTGSLQYRLRGARHVDVAQATHLSVFTSLAVRTLLGRAGLRDIRRLVFWGGRAGFGPLRNFAQLIARYLELGSGLYFTAVR